MIQFFVCVFFLHDTVAMPNKEKEPPMDLKNKSKGIIIVHNNL